MAVLSDAELAKSIRQGEFSPVYLLYGKETYQLQKHLSALIRKSVGKQSSCFNLQQFDGNRVTVSEIIDAAEAYPVMADKKCVTVSSLDLDKLPEKDFLALKELVKDPPPDTVLIFHYTGNEIDPKKSNRQKSFLGLVEKSGTVTEFKFLSQSQLEKVLLDTAAKSGCKLSPYLACYLIDRCGDSLSVLLTEMEKLCCFVGSGEITKENVDMLTVKTIEASAFDLAKAILKREY